MGKTHPYYYGETAAFEKRSSSGTEWAAQSRDMTINCQIQLRQNVELYTDLR